MSPKDRVRPDGALRAVAYEKVMMAERLENPFDEAGNCYILYRPDSEHMKSDSLMLPTSDNIFYTVIFEIVKTILQKLPGLSVLFPTRKKYLAGYGMRHMHSLL
ncbi:MAG: hypothetical protein HFG80_08460 [Eubacterium sp.]|nr:hypothetical protein [Eubacterium sp.]